MKRGFKDIGLERVTEEFLRLKELLDSIGVEVFLMAGTLLGAIRDGALIEHDTDVDLGVMDESVMEKILKELGPHYDEAHYGPDVKAGKILWLKRYFGEYELPFEFQCHYPHKHVIFYNREMDDTWKCYETHVEYPKHLFEELTSIEFLGKSFLVPNPPEEWLNIFYGENWRTPEEYVDWRYHCPIFMSGYLSERPLE